MSEKPVPFASVGRFAMHHAVAIAFIAFVLCLGGILAAYRMPSSVFPKTEFPRCVILAENGVMPADEMMATVTRPIEEAMKDVPGTVSVRSNTGRGSAEVNVFFNWQTDMVQAELFVQSRLAQIRAALPTTATTAVWRLTFNAFPIIGVSLTSPTRDIAQLWETARYDLKPRLLHIPGVARVDLVGGRQPEFHVVVDPLRLGNTGLGLPQVVDALRQGNLIAPAGFHEEEHTLFLTVIDGRVHNEDELADFVVGGRDGHSVRIRDFARVERAPEPAYNIVTSQGVNAVLLNIRSQPDGSTLDIADGVERVLAAVRRELPPALKLALFYDQSVMVRASVRSVWEAIAFGLILSVLIIYFFLKNWGTTLTAIVVIPATVLITLVAMQVAGLGFNLMTLGGIAAAIGLVIDDAIVVVEAIYARMLAGGRRLDSIQQAIDEIFKPLVGSTLTPVVVFLPLAFLDGLTGVFFRALALTMAVSLLTSLVLAITVTPALAGWFIRVGDRAPSAPHPEEGGRVLRGAVGLYERAVRLALRHRGLALAACALVFLAAGVLYTRLKSDFLPPMDEGGFVIDYHMPWGTSLAETDRQLHLVEKILSATPEIEGYSRRTGARLALAITEPNAGDYLVKLRSDRRRPTDEVIAELRRKILVIAPKSEWELHGILGELIGDLTSSPKPIEVKFYSTNIDTLKEKAPAIEEKLKSIPGVVDTSDGLTYTGPAISLRVRQAEALRFGLTAKTIAAAVHTAMLGEIASSVLEGDRVIAIRVRVEKASLGRIAALRELPLRTGEGGIVQLAQVAEVYEEPGHVELRRDDLRQNVAVTARLEGRDLGSAIAEIRRQIDADDAFQTDEIEYGGIYEQQQESFRHLLIVLAAAILLVFTVLLVEFRSFYEPVAIMFGALLALFGTVLALWITGTTLNVVSFLGAIIGVGIVAKNGILMLDFVDQLVTAGMPLHEALVRSGRRRLRPVLMTSLAAALGLLPLAYGIGSGADMLKPLAIAVIGALCISVLLSLVATPTVYSLLRSRKPKTSE